MPSSTHTIPFHIVDVFAKNQFEGNQLAVVDRADGLSDALMQQIAAEFGFSETTFIRRDSSDPPVFDVSIYTPEAEVPFAGHPTLGTGYVLRESFEAEQQSEVHLALPAGVVPVSVESRRGGETFWMRQPDPEFITEFEHDTLATVLGLDVKDIDRTVPVESVTTGLPTVIVPLKSRAALKRIVIDSAAYDDFVAGHEAKNVLAFCADPRNPSSDVAVRVFAPFYGVPEDPATGSSNGCLAAYLAEHRYFDSETVDITVEQGSEIGRPSRLLLRAEVSNAGSTVRVGGDVTPVAQGNLSVR